MLTRRLEGLLGAGADLTRLIAITYTEKAAAELKSRLRRLCDDRYTQAVGEGNEAERQRWGRHRRDLEAAYLGTIHSFCARLLRVHALRLSTPLDPRFAVLDETAGVLFVRDCVRDHILRQLRAGDEGLRALVAGLGFGGLTSGFVAMIGARGKPAFDRLPTSPAEVRALWDEVLATHAAREAARLGSDPEVLAAADTLRIIEPTDAADKLADIRRRVLPLVETALAADTPPREAAEAWIVIQSLPSGGNVGRQGNWPGESIQLVRGALRTLREKAKGLSHLAPAGEAVEASAAELTARFCTALPGVFEAYTQAKREQSRLDFEDMLILARDLLRDFPDVRAAEQQRFEHVLVDEFQDTDPVQRELIWYLAEAGAKATRLDEVRLRPGRLFVVGDVKQSIYAFRGADVTVYDDTRREFGEAPECEVVSLTANFRSQPRLVAFFNDLFSLEAVMGPDRDTRRPFEAFYEPLQATRLAPATDPDVTLILAPAEGAAIGDLRAILADRLARTLADGVRSGTIRVADRDADGNPVLDGEGNPALRPATWGDVLILFPTMTSIQTYEQALRVHAVPYYVVAGKGFYHRPEVLDVVTLLRVLDDPQDEIALARVLRSPMFCVSDEGLYWLAQAARLAAGLAALQAGEDDFLRNLSPDDSSHAQRAAEVLARVRAVKDRLPPSELVARLLEDTSLPALVAAQFDGQRAYANLQKLVEIARDFERGDSQSLAGFIEYVETLRTQEVREGEAPAEEERGDVVTLMTIHKAKGLEAPVVVVADLARGGSRPSRAPLVLHPEAGPIVKGEAEDGATRLPALGEAALLDGRDREAAERKRLLYVALTRAEDRLIIATPLPLKKDGSPSGGEHVQGLWDAFGDRLLTEDRIEGESGSWQAEVILAAEPPAEVPSVRAGRSLLATHADAIRAAEPIPAQDAEAEEAILRRVRELGPDLAARTRFTVTELSAYRRCPRCFELRYVRGFEEHRRPSEPTPTGRLTPQERGTVTHRALQRLGRGPVGNLRALVEAAMRESGLAGHDPQEIAAIIEAVERFVESPTWEIVRAATDLRTEATVVARFEEGLLEGQVDALLTDAEGRVHLIDYKTGRSAETGTQAEQLFQVGAYAAALERCRGALPASVTVHYLTGDEPVEAPVMETARNSAREAEEAMRGIREGRYPRAADCDPSCCGYGWVCVDTDAPTPPPPSS